MDFKLKNKGISYIEFILVISIMFLLTGFATITMSVVNKNNVKKAADKIATGMNQAKTLSLAKGVNKGCITFAQKGGKYYYYYGSNDDKKYYVCTPPCTLKVIINDTAYAITDTQRVQIRVNQTTGAFSSALLTLNGGTNYTDIVSGSNYFTGTNGIQISNKQGKTAKVDLNIYVGTVEVTY